MCSYPGVLYIGEICPGRSIWVGKFHVGGRASCITHAIVDRNAEFVQRSQ